MPNELPINWGKDKLSEFLDLSEKNQLATFANKREAFHLLSEIDDCIQTTIEHLIDCEPYVTVLMFLRSHASYRAACRIAMAGQFVESFPLCRLVLECGLYGFHIYKNDPAEKIWISRGNDSTSEREARKEFSYRNVLRTLQDEDSKLANVASTLYERAIDYGGHPNEAGFTASLQVLRHESSFEPKQVYLHGDSTQLELGLKTVAQCGLLPLKLAQKMWDFRVRFSGVSERIDNLKKENL